MMNPSSAVSLVPDDALRRIIITAVHKLTKPERDQLLAQAGHPPPHGQANDPGAAPR